MDFYDDSPATKFFMDESFEIITKKDGSFGVTLFMSFLFGAESNVSLGVWDYRGTTVESHRFAGTTAEDVDKFLTQVKQDYGLSSLPETFSVLPSLFFVYAGSGFGLSVDLDSEEAVSEVDYDDSQVEDEDYYDPNYCETCGEYYVNGVEGFYFPAFSDVPASLGVHWNYGCFGGDKISGEFTEVLPGVLLMLDRVAGVAEGAELEDVQAFKAQLLELAKK